jgi:hypothetical protein
MKPFTLSYAARGQHDRSRGMPALFGAMGLGSSIFGLGCTIAAITGYLLGDAARTLVFGSAVLACVFLLTSRLVEPTSARIHRRWTSIFILVNIITMFVAYVAIRATYVRGKRIPEDVVRAQARIRGTYQSLLIYANSHKGRFPDSLSELSTSDPTARLDYYNDFRSGFVYFGKDRTNPMDGKALLDCETLGQHSSPGAWACFGDGHIEWLSPAEYSRLVPSNDRRAEEN